MRRSLSKPSSTPGLQPTVTAANGFANIPSCWITSETMRCRGLRRRPSVTTHDADWLTVREVARRLSVHPKQIRKWVREGQFDEIAVFSQRLLRISRASYERFVKKSRAA